MQTTPTHCALHKPRCIAPRTIKIYSRFPSAQGSTGKPRKERTNCLHWRGQRNRIVLRLLRANSAICQHH
jgi:hypothetical protein